MASSSSKKSDSDSNTTEMKLDVHSGNTEETKLSEALEDIVVLSNGTNDSESSISSNRNKQERRRSRRQNTARASKPKTKYDEHGRLHKNKLDLCDCLDEHCLGCHFPCPKCRSGKCGHECRQNRKWMYEQIEIEGSDIVHRNPYLD